MFCTPYQLPSPMIAKTPRPFVVYVENSRFLPNFLEKSTILRIWSTPVDQNFYVTKNTKISSFWPYFWNFHISKILEDILLWISNPRGPGFQITSFIYQYFEQKKKWKFFINFWLRNFEIILFNRFVKGKTYNVLVSLWVQFKE